MPPSPAIAIVLGMTAVSVATAEEGVDDHDAAQTAEYACPLDKSGYPGQIDRIEIAVDSADAKPRAVRIRFHSGDSSFAMIAVGGEPEAMLSREPRIAPDRYLLETAGGHVLEFRRRETGRPFLPYSFELQPEVVLPACFDAPGRFAPSIRFLDKTYALKQTGSLGGRIEVPDARPIVLSDDLLIGTSRNARDVDGRRITMREFVDDEQLKYTYRVFDDSDLARMLAAGFNYFDRVVPAQLEYLIDKPAFFDLNTFVPEIRPFFPEVLFHPGFVGVEDFLDEPAYIYWEDWRGPIPPGQEFTPADMARRQEERTLSEFNRETRGRMAGINERLAFAKIDLKELELVEPPIPIWDEFFSTGCYQLHVPVSGFIQEGRYRHPEVVKLLNNTFRISLPRRPESMFRFYFAFLRGAARVYDKDWGMSIYGQADREVSLLGMTMAYDRGARYIWFWSSDRHHHVPFEEQLDLAAGLTAHIKAHPRGDRHRLIRAANDAVVLPYGFTFSISDWQKNRMEDLWQREFLSLQDGTLPDGTTYYSVLRCAAEAMEELVDADREFDIVVDVPRLPSAGYGRLHHVLSEARERNYRYPVWVHYKLHIALAALVAFLIGFRTYRTVRWLRRRAKRGARQQEASSQY